MIAGIDEAGRGAVIGPLIIAIAYADRDIAHELLRNGAKDSKELTHASRLRVLERCKGFCEFEIIKIPARELNELMERMSINEIEAMKIGEALEKLAVKRAYIDSPTPIAASFAGLVRKYCSKPVKLICEHRSDKKHAIVAIASIAAKVEREREVERIARELGYFGSGYPSDERTMRFLKENFRNPKLKRYLRTKWQTVERLKQRKLSEF